MFLALSSLAVSFIPGFEFVEFFVRPRREALVFVGPNFSTSIDLNLLVQSKFRGLRSLFLAAFDAVF